MRPPAAEVQQADAAEGDHGQDHVPDAGVCDLVGEVATGTLLSVKLQAMPDLASAGSSFAIHYAASLLADPAVPEGYSAFA